MKHRKDVQAGYATAEFAIALPAVVLVIVLMVGFSMAGAAKVQACDAARSAARAHSIGQAAPSTDMAASVSVSTAGTWVKATARPQLSSLLSPLSATLSCSVWAMREESVVGVP